MHVVQYPCTCVHILSLSYVETLPINWNELVSPGLADLLGQFHDSKLADKVETNHDHREQDCDNVGDVPRVREKLRKALFLHPEQIRH